LYHPAGKHPEKVCGITVWFYKPFSGMKITLFVVFEKPSQRKIAIIITNKDAEADGIYLPSSYHYHGLLYISATPHGRVWQPPFGNYLVFFSQ
jgi:hypothetical protein